MSAFSTYFRVETTVTTRRKDSICKTPLGEVSLFFCASFRELSQVKDVIHEAAAGGMMWLTFTGHSLGGAVANLLAVQYELRYPHVGVRLSFF